MLSATSRLLRRRPLQTSPYVAPNEVAHSENFHKNERSDRVVTGSGMFGRPVLCGTGLS